METVNAAQARIKTALAKERDNINRLNIETCEARNRLRRLEAEWMCYVDPNRLEFEGLTGAGEGLLRKPTNHYWSGVRAQVETGSPPPGVTVPVKTGDAPPGTDTTTTADDNLIGDKPAMLGE